MFVKSAVKFGEIDLVKIFLKAMGSSSIETPVLHGFKYTGRDGVVLEMLRSSRVG